MDAAQALADLTEISSQIQAAVLIEASGSVISSTLEDDGRTRLLRSEELPAGCRGARWGRQAETESPAAGSRGTGERWRGVRPSPVCCSPRAPWWARSPTGAASPTGALGSISTT